VNSASFTKVILDALDSIHANTLNTKLRLSTTGILAETL